MEKLSRVYKSMLAKKALKWRVRAKHIRELLVANKEGRLLVERIELNGNKNYKR